jgi:hypothetical protein
MPDAVSLITIAASALLLTFAPDPSTADAVTVFFSSAELAIPIIAKSAISRNIYLIL